MALKLKPADDALDVLSSTRPSDDVQRWTSYCASYFDAHGVSAPLNLDAFKLKLDLDALKLDTWQLQAKPTTRIRLKPEYARRRLSSTPGTRIPIRARRVKLDDAYRGTSTLDGMSQNATKPTLKRTPLDVAVPLSDVTLEHPAMPTTLTLKTRARRVERLTLDDSVAESATLDAYRKHRQAGGR